MAAGKLPLMTFDPARTERRNLIKAMVCLMSLAKITKVGRARKAVPGVGERRRNRS